MIFSLHNAISFTESFGETLWHDLRYAVRTLLKSRGFTAVAVLTMALGVGAATVIFSVVCNVLIDPLPYKDFDRSIVFSVRGLTDVGGWKGRTVRLSRRSTVPWTILYLR